jgi:hypothetical protein
MTALIEEGAGDMDSRGFAEARDALAAEFVLTPAPTPSVFRPGS